MADKRCENGHFIDASWDICPYCPPDQSAPEIPVVRPRREDRPQRDFPREVDSSFVPRTGAGLDAVEPPAGPQRTV
ncbi:MAG TPA: hypothetical protein VM534_04060, partial [Thermoanaerobaculia bacterium]|nr:hypothetical protein [Thermoanaerobaculia bacterium]